MFDQWEDDLKKAVQRAQAPFLGLLGGLVPQAARQEVLADIAAAPGAWDFAQRLDQYPALFAVWLAEHVMHGMGQHGTYEVHPFVQRAVGAPAPLNNADRDRLNAAFRRALRRVGLEPMPLSARTAYRLIGDYVRQAGVPLAFADDLSQKMLRHAKRVGLPEEEDHEGLQAWQTSLVNHLQLPFSKTASDAVSRDTQAYYAHAFARLVNNGGQPEQGNVLEEALARAFVATSGGVNLRRTAPPQLLYRDGCLGLLLPAGQPGAYRVQWGQEVLQARCGDEGLFFPLPSSLATEISVNNPDGQIVLRSSIWADGRNNRLIVFREVGRLAAQAQLAQDSEVEMPPGRYVALCRFEPDDADAVELLSDTPTLFEAHFELRPGGRRTLNYGPASVAFVGQERPALTLEGSCRTSLERLNVYYGGVEAVVDVPADWADTGGLELRLRTQSGQTFVRIAVPASAEGAPARLTLVDAFRQLNLAPGLHRLQLEVALVGEARAQQRASAWYWAGLRRVTGAMAFEWDSVPANLNTVSCRGLTMNGAGARPSDDLHRNIRLAFELSPGRLTYLTWNRPGTFLEVEAAAADGTMVRTRRPLGSNESVSSTQRKTIIVSASGSGRILLGSWALPVDFARTPSKSFGAGFLAGKLESGASSLQFHADGTSTAQTLLQLSQPHVADAFSVQRLGNVLDFKFRLRGNARALTVTAADLHRGLRRESRCELATGLMQNGGFARSQMYAAAIGSGCEVQLLIDYSTIDPGTWLLSFEGDLDGIVGRLEDTDQGRLGACIMISETGEELSPQNVIGKVGLLSDAELVTALRTLAAYFHVYWSPLCGERLGWLGRYWSLLLARVGEDASKHLTTLIDLCCLETDPDGRPGWLPKQFAGGQLPAAFALRRSDYRKVNQRAEPLARALRCMGDFRTALAGIFGKNVCASVAMAFENPARIQRGEWPKGFSMARYKAVLQATPLEQSYRLEDRTVELAASEMLGTLHVSLGWLDIERRFAANEQFPTRRRALAITIARHLALRQGAFPASAPAGLRDQSPLVVVGQPEADTGDDQRQQFHENLRHIAQACSLLAWHCRLASRQPAALTSFIDQLDAYRLAAGIDDMSIDGCVSFYVQTAPTLFGYYLMLWELVQASAFDTHVVHG